MRRIAVLALVTAAVAPLASAHGKKEKAPASAAAVPPGAAGATGSIAGHVTLLEKAGPQPGTAAFVYVEKADPSLWRDDPRRAQLVPPTGLEMSMASKEFKPRVLPVLVDEAVRFPNLDPVFHNVFSLTGKNKFDLGLYKDGASKTKAFPAPGVVRVFCNIHPKMTGYLLVLQNPWIARPDADGKFTLPDVPPGRYTVKAWHERGGELAREVEVVPGKPAAADFVLDASGFRELPHKNKFGQDYGTGY